MTIKKPHHIIAIGASAGGMEEINTFFDHTPLDGLSYIIVQHLSPDFKSRMVELLAKHSKLTIKEAENEMVVKCNLVYLIPNNKFMTIHDGKLYLTDKDKGHAPHLTINRFFNSLADDCGKKAIAVILSGLGSDGAEGIKAVKKAGGMIIVRNPETSEFSSMPAHAVATGMVDLVLEPELMPGAIEDYIKQEGELFTDTRDDDENLAAIIALINEQSPLDFTDYKQNTILRQIKRKAANSNFTKLGDYLAFLKATPLEAAALAKEFLISVTAFFRDNEAFDLIAKEVLPDLLKKLTPGEELKMWVAACATGEEAYSIAILIAEQLTGDFEDTVVKIFATDIDGPALVYAGKGIYNAGITKTVSPERIERYFLKEGSNFRVNPGIRKMVIFAHHDMVKNPPYCNMHFISCRNLLIYMTPVLQKKIFSMLLFGLKRDGYLFLGSSESPTPIIQNLEMVSKTWKVYKNLKSKREVSFDAFSMPVFVDAKRLISPITHDISKNNSNFLDEAVNINFANEFDCLTICIDQNNNVLKSYGNTAKYLRQKNFSSNLPELLPRQLALAFSTLSKTALKTGERVVVNGIKTKYNQSIIKVGLAINPVNIKKGEPKVLMVTIYEDKSFNPGQSDATEFDENTLNNQYTIDIEEELKEMKDKLHLAYEQLDASNENMQSFNEEMISANEEMQSTNEEMQSINEELNTINADYQLKNKELLEINDDLNNYFRSNINGQLFINNELKLMKFSPGTVKQINLLDTDIGRPLSNISTNIKFETIIDDTKKVMKDGCVITKEIETNDGKWYQIMTMPYVKQVGNRNSGAIITFNDVTELKKTQLELDKKNESLMRINADLDHFVHAASHDLLGPLGNIEGSIELMNSKIVDPEQNKFMSVITLSLRKFRALIQDIAMIARIEGDNIDKEMVDIDELINNIEWSLENKINLAGAIITRDLKVKKVRFSKKNLRSIVYNLISNAIKFRREEIPLIKVNTLQEGDYVILSVQDNGKGIPPDGLNKIFDMYGRLHQDIEGQGVGLYLAKKIINAANGHINVESEPGVGSKFVIFLKT